MTRLSRMWLTLLSILISAHAFAQTTISGNVVDAQTGQPVAGAAIVQTGTTNGTVSDSQGNFQIKVAQLPANLEATFGNAIPANQSVESADGVTLMLNQKPAHKLTRDEILAMSTDELSELSLEDLMDAVETLGVSSVDELFALIMNKQVSSASKAEESSFTSPLATTVITRDELRTYGATTIEDAFRLIPGMIVAQKFNGVYDIHMRGLNNLPDNNSLLYTENNNTLLMVDGRIVQNYITGAVQMDRLPISIADVERIEVVRGACGALYGMNAVNGVINIITEKPTSASSVVSGGFQMGNLNTYIGDVAIRKAFSDKWAAGVTFNIQHRGRPTSDVYVVPQEGLYLANSTEAYSNLLNAKGGSSAEERQQVLADNATPIDPAGGYYSVDEVSRLIKAVTQQNASGDEKLYLYRANEKYASVRDIYPNPGEARKNFGFNGYLRFTPKPDMTFDLTGGYQRSYVNNTPFLEYVVDMAGQESKTAYVNLEASIKNLHFLGNFAAGPQDLAVGISGFKTGGYTHSVSLDYDFRLLDDKLSIRPAIAQQGLYYKDYDQTYEGTEMSGFFNDQAHLDIISPSVRIDYRNNGWRFIAGLRGDKTSAPDKWNVSWQGEVSKLINDRNFIRAVYGRSYRAPNLINTATSYSWNREQMSYPSTMRFLGSTDADLMMIDNFEIGYRFKPTNNILLDAEIFYSKSKDYGALMADKTVYTLTQSAFNAAVAQMLSGGAGGPGGKGAPDGAPDGGEGAPDDGGSGIDYSRTVSSMMTNSMTTRTDIVYRNLPYEVHQMGLSLNLDWIISPKLILKLNANVQKTLVNNYYEYSQAKAISDQYNGYETGSWDDDSYYYYYGARRATMTALNQILPNVTDEKFTSAVFGKAYMDEFKAESGYDSWTYVQQWEFMNALEEAYNNSEDGIASVNYDFNGHKGTYTGLVYSLYYGLQYGVHNVRQSEGDENVYEIGETGSKIGPMSDKHVHKSTPAVYGMIGLVYKPIKQLTISAYGNYMHHRTYNTSYSNSFAQVAKANKESAQLNREWYEEYGPDYLRSIGHSEEEIKADYEADMALIAEYESVADRYASLAKNASKVRSKFSLNMKVGYMPSNNIELFVNAQNLFNNNLREFVYTDKIGGLYTVGVNFNF